MLLTIYRLLCISMVVLALVPHFVSAAHVPVVVRCDNLRLASRLFIPVPFRPSVPHTDAAGDAGVMDAALIDMRARELMQLQRMCLEVTVDLLGIMGAYVRTNRVSIGFQEALRARPPISIYNSTRHYTVTGILSRFYSAVSEMNVMVRVMGQSERAQCERGGFTLTQTLWAELRYVSSRITAVQCRLYNVLRMSNAPVPEVTLREETIASLQTPDRILRFKRSFAVASMAVAIFSDMAEAFGELATIRDN